MARRFAVWGLLNLLIAGPTLGLMAAFNVASDGDLLLRGVIFQTHAWMTMMGWCVPTVFALVCWLLPLFKDVRLRGKATQVVCLLLLIAAAAGQVAYLLLAHRGRPSVFLQPPIWGGYLVAGIIYTNLVWRLTSRTLRPTATDVGIQSGAVWLLLVMVVRTIAALGMMATGRSDYLASSDAAILVAIMFGFLGNTALALVAAIAPAFLMTAHARAKVLSAFHFYNGALAVWCGGAAWVLAFPYSWGRLLLALAGFIFTWSVIRLLVELRLLDLFLLRAESRRRRFTATALGTAVLMLIVSVIIITVISIWNAATMDCAPQEMIVLTMHVFTIGFFSNIVMGLFVPVLGVRSLANVKLVLAYGAYILFLVWLVAKLGLATAGIISGEAMWAERYQVGWLAGGAAFLLFLWLFAAMSSGGRAPAGSPENVATPPAPGV